MNATAPITGTLEHFYSRRDIYGNCYHAFTFHAADGRSVSATISGGESNVYAVRQCLNNDVEGWDERIRFTSQEMKIRDFNRATKELPHAGCVPDDIAAFIRDNLA